MKIFHSLISLQTPIQVYTILCKKGVFMKDKKKNKKKPAQPAVKIEKESNIDEKPKTVATSDKSKQKQAQKK